MKLVIWTYETHFVTKCNQTNSWIFVFLIRNALESITYRGSPRFLFIGFNDNQTERNIHTLSRWHNVRKSIAEDDNEEEPEDPTEASGRSKFTDFFGAKLDAIERSGSPESEVSFWDRTQRSLGGAGALWKFRSKKAREDRVGKDRFRWTAMTVGFTAQDLVLYFFSLSLDFHSRTTKFGPLQFNPLL